MTYLLSALFLGGVCLIAQLIFEYTKMTPGHITSLFASIGALLASFGIYNTISEYAPGGASLAILNYGNIMTTSVINSADQIKLLLLLTILFYIHLTLIY